MSATTPAPPIAADLPQPPAHNLTGVDFTAPIPRPAGVDEVGGVIDCHSHLFAADHAADWFEAADRFGIDHTITMTPLEEVLRLQNGPFGDRCSFINVPSWRPDHPDPASMYAVDPFRRRLEAFHNLGVRVVKIHQSPGTIAKHGMKIGSDWHRTLLDAIRASGSVIMSHIGDPKRWYAGKYAEEPETFGTQDEHYAAWERLLEDYRGTPWWGAHLGGRPEDLDYLDDLLGRFPDLWLDLSATTWMVRELSLQPEAARAFMIRRQDRLMWGSDQVSIDPADMSGRDADFFASRWWTHRTLWESTYRGESPIRDPAMPDGRSPLVGLDLPTDVLRKLYGGNVRRLLRSVGVTV